MKRIERLRNSDGTWGTISEVAAEYYVKQKGQSGDIFESRRENLRTLKSKSTANERKFVDRLLHDFESLVTANSQESENFIREYNKIGLNNIVYDSSGQTKFGEAIESAFSYKSFRKSAKAYWLASRFDIKACLYCNAQFAIRLEGRGNKFLFQFDHFFDKKRYPYLSLTIGNLVPVCASCNQIKSSAEFSIEKNIHPFVDELHDKFVFNVDHAKIIRYLLNPSQLDLLKPEIISSDKKAQDHINFFDLSKLYEQHADIVEELVWKQKIYNSSRRSELKTAFKALKMNGSLFDRFILGNYTLDEDLNKRPLSKMTKDIAKQLKLI